MLLLHASCVRRITVLDDKALCLQLFLVIITFLQSIINCKTLNEMKKSRRGSYAPLLTPKIGAEKKGVFDGDIAHHYDMEVTLEPTAGSSPKIPLTPFDITVTNNGEGPMVDLKIKGSASMWSFQTSGAIPLIKAGESRQIRFSLSLEREMNEGETISILATYENVFGEKYQQKWNVILDRVFYQQHQISHNKAKRIN